MSTERLRIGHCVSGGGATINNSPLNITFNISVRMYGDTAKDAHALARMIQAIKETLGHDPATIVIEGSTKEPRNG